jgi:hypothetical protein
LADAETFTHLLEEADRYCGHLGVGKDVLIQTFREPSDWAFVIKIDALHETACRDTLSRLLMLRGVKGRDEETAAFANDLSFVGRSSMLRLIGIAGCPDDEMRLIDAVRRVRNAFAHDVRAIGRPLLELILARQDRSHLLRTFSAIADEGYNEAVYLDLLKRDPGLLRFGILHQSMVFLYLMDSRFPHAG